jgi:hypothetical protein
MVDQRLPLAQQFQASVDYGTPVVKKALLHLRLNEQFILGDRPALIAAL